MPILTILLVLIVTGVVLYLISRFIAHPLLKNVLIGFVIILLIIWVLTLLFPNVLSMRI